MARITEQEVHAAAQALDAKGVKPTTIKVRELLSKGSYSTIQKFLDTWESPAPETAEAPEIPESVEALLPTIWTACYAEAERMIGERVDAAHADASAARADLESATAALDDAEAQIEKLTGELAAALEKAEGERQGRQQAEMAMMQAKEQTTAACARAERAERQVEQYLEKSARQQSAKQTPAPTGKGKKGKGNAAEQPTAAELEQKGQQRII